MALNHSSMTGPKNRPTSAVPCFCTTNRPTRIPAVMGTIQSLKTGVATPSPSMAERTEIAGVMTLSP
ncbi:hypothetical protein GALL_477710 [mine drainage metagenome]|uniref:Uncharacterized protein n=1 Tax=mine drainage metagenome TaxID=410659 RepID=A0A1J5PSN9_9ZZZZ